MLRKEIISKIPALWAPNYNTIVKRPATKLNETQDYHFLGGAARRI